MSDFLPDGTRLSEGQKYHDMSDYVSTPLLDISMTPISIVFDIVAYLHDHTEAEMWDMLGKLRDFK